MKPLIQSSSEAPFTCSRLPTSHHPSARCYPYQATPLHHRWRMCISALSTFVGTRFIASSFFLNEECRTMFVCTCVVYRSWGGDARSERSYWSTSSNLLNCEIIKLK